MRWEYKTVKLAIGNFESSSFELTEVDRFINQFGYEGWQLVATQGIDSYEFGGQTYTKEVVLFFRRAIDN